METIHDNNSETRLMESWNSLPILNVEESETLELKTSIAYPPDTKGEANIDKQLNNIVKELTAFMNTNGGQLLIGIHDKTKKVLGIEGDFSHLNEGDDKYAGTYKCDKDGYELKIRNTIDWKCQSLANSLITFEFPEIEGCVYCKITVNRAQRPIFLNGTQLWIRQGNRLKKLEGDDITFFITERNFEKQTTNEETGEDCRGQEKEQNIVPIEQSIASTEKETVKSHIHTSNSQEIFVNQTNKANTAYRDELTKANEYLALYYSAINQNSSASSYTNQQQHSTNSIATEDKDTYVNSLFEDYLLDRFAMNKHKCFTRLESWPSEPEIIIELSAYGQTRTFAVAIDYRSKWTDYCLHWEYLKAYRDYAKQIDGKVYFVLGVGGKPEQPRDVYIVPLSSMKKGQSYSKSDWAKYLYHNPTGNLRYNISDDTLYFN